MAIRKTVVPAIAALLLIGVGCAPTTSPSADSPAQETDAPATSKPDSEAGADASLETTVPLDDTWKTYVNKALSFEFNWPTKGRYAPRWEVTFVSEGDARIKDGCIVEGSAGTRHVTVGASTFCHSWKDDGSGPTDWYAVKHDSRYAVIRFTKSPTVPDEGFSLEEYRAHLDQIISTYKSTK